MLVVVAAVVDIKTKTIHDAVSLGIFVLGLIGLFTGLEPFLNNKVLVLSSSSDIIEKSSMSFFQNFFVRIIGMGIISLPMFALNLISKKVNREIENDEIIGLGDVFFCGALGFLLGPFGILESALTAFVFAGIFAGGGILFGRLKRKDSIPLIPFFALGMTFFLIVRRAGL